MKYFISTLVALTAFIPSHLNAGTLSISSRLEYRKSTLYISTARNGNISGFVFKKGQKFHFNGKVIGSVLSGADGACSFSLKLIPLKYNGIIRGHFTRTVTRDYFDPSAPTVYGLRITDEFTGSTSNPNLLSPKTTHFNFLGSSIDYPDLY